MEFIKNIFKKLASAKKERLNSTYESYGNTLKNVITTKDQRLEAIEALEEAPPEVAVKQFMKRFEMVLDHGIQDTKEKERVCETIYKYPEFAKPLIIEQMKSGRRISWMIKLAEKMFSNEEYLNILLENLKLEFVEFDDTLLERNTELLLALKEINDPKITSKAKVLLQSRDEGIRMAALECLEAQASTCEEAKTTILELSNTPSTDDNSRFLGVIRSIIQKNKWK